MKISVLASGSRGNSTFIEINKTKILIDIGMSCLYIENNLKDIGVDPKEINCVFVTHTHIDHVAGIRVFIKKYNPTVYLTFKMFEDLKDILNSYYILDDVVYLDDVTVNYFKTSHDASDSVGYVFSSEAKKVVYVTDTGYINQKYYPLLADSDLYIFESNHDIKMLMDNPDYPYHTKQRILSDRGHLSNADSAYYLKKIVGNNTKHIILAHLSSKNNDPEIALNTVKDEINNVNIFVASQNTKTELIEI